MRLSANAETDGRYHSKWLSMMYPRLFLARNLLRDDGVIFVSIDDHEMHNLRLLMNDVFGEEAFIACCVWQKRYSRENRGAIGDAHEYLLVYGRDTALFQGSRGLITPTDKQTAVYRNPNADPKGRWRSVPMTAQGYRPNQMYEVVTPSGARHRPPEGRCWSCIETEYLRLRAEGRIYFGQDSSAQPGIIRYLSEMEGLVPWTWWPSEEVGHTDEARKEIQEIFGTQTAFDTPKPTRLMKRVLEIGCGRDDIVLDFFAGSGTMGQAVIEQNATDGGQRRCVLVQLPEPVADDPTRPVADGSTRPAAEDSTRTVADVTRTRLRWAIDRCAKAPLRLGGNAQPPGFRAYRLTSSNFAVWEGSDIRRGDVQRHLSLLANNIADGRSQTDLLTELLMKAGYPLTANVAELAMAGKSVFSIDDNSLLICLEPALTIELFEAMADLKSSLIIVLDVGFGSDDQLKVNALQTIRSHRSDSQASTELKVV